MKSMTYACKKLLYTLLYTLSHLPFARIGVAPLVGAPNLRGVLQLEMVRNWKTPWRNWPGFGQFDQQWSDSPMGAYAMSA